jgi:hypothetical protein
MYTRSVLAPLLPLVMGCSVPSLPSAPWSDAPEKPAPTLVISEPRPPITTTPQPVALGPDEPPIGATAENCGDLQDGGPVAGPDCVTAEVKCGEVVYGHTFGGVNRFTTKFYERWRCTPAMTNHDSGEERAYLLRMPEGEHHLDIWLDTPCADLDLAVMRMKDFQTCPDLDTLVPTCDMWPKKGKQREHIELSVQGKTDFLIVVEGKDAEEGAFALTVQCGQGLY